MIEAKVICDSISNEGYRLTTFQLRYPKFIHGELMTHRVFSRNASSSRAMPVAKSIEEATHCDLRAMPVYWGREQKGMASGKEFTDFTDPNHPIYLWELAALEAARHAQRMVAFGVHKSIVNRILEPYLHINVVVSATGYMNFFGLRLDLAAQPEMRVLAENMWREYNESKPRLLLPGQWHLPFVDGETADELCGPEGQLSFDDEDWIRVAIKVSVARCARVSYMSFDTGKISTVEEDLKLYDKLVGAQPLHASPAEHQATPDVRPIGEEWEHANEWGNFFGWRQHRKMLVGESLAPLPMGYRT